MHSKAFSVFSKVVCVLPSFLYRISGFNDSATDSWLMLFDAKAVPANGTAPKEQYQIFADSPYILVFGKPLTFSSGIVAVTSSTKDTLTIIDDATIQIDIQAEFESPNQYAATATYGTAAAVYDDQVPETSLTPHIHLTSRKRLLSLGISSISAAYFVTIDYQTWASGESTGPTNRVVYALPAGAAQLDLGQGAFEANLIKISIWQDAGLTDPVTGGDVPTLTYILA